MRSITEIKSYTQEEWNEICKHLETLDIRDKLEFSYEFGTEGVRTHPDKPWPKWVNGCWENWTVYKQGWESR